MPPHRTRRVFIYEDVVRQPCLVALDIGECISYLALTHDFFNLAFVALACNRLISVWVWRCISHITSLRLIWAQHAQLLSGRRMMLCRHR